MLFSKNFLAIISLILIHICFFTHIVAMVRGAINPSTEADQISFWRRVTHPETWDDKERRYVSYGCLGGGAVTILCGIGILIGWPFAVVAAGTSAGMKAGIPTAIAGGLCGFCMEGSGVVCVHCGSLIRESAPLRRPMPIVMNRDDL